MPLTLPSVLGRIFTALTDKFQSAQISGDAFPSQNVFGDGAYYTSDGTEDLTNPALVYARPRVYIRRRTNELGLVIRGKNDGQLHNLIEIQDNFGAPITWVSEAGGGLKTNDNLIVTFSPVNGPQNFFADIYGNMQLGADSNVACNAGPPGNILTFVDACGERFQRDRSGQVGGWTATNATYATRDEGSGLSPGGLRFVRRWTASSAATMTMITPAGTSAYPCTSGQFVTAMIKTRSATTARSKTPFLVWYLASGASAGADAAGTAVTDTTTGWTDLKVSGVAPPGAVFVALKYTVTAPANGEAHDDTCAGIWRGLRLNQLTAWSPPYVFRQDAFGGANANGNNDGANVGDVYIRADGPGNVVQRFWTNVTAGKPWQQSWVSDPRLTSNPGKLNWYGGTYLVQGASSSADYVLPNVVIGMLHNDPLDSVNRGVTSAKLMDESAGASQAGGQSTFVQSVKKKSTGQPYVSKDGVFVLFFGLWDMAGVTAAQGFGVMSRITAYSAAGGTTAAFINTLRDVISRARASVILETTHAAFVMANGANSGVVPYASGGAPGTGGTFYNTTNPTPPYTLFTFTIPADFEGGTVSFSFIGNQGPFGGTVTWTGTAPGASGTTALSNNSDPGFRAKVCKRFTGLTAADAGKTYICSVTALDASGSVGVDCAYIEGPNPNLVFVCGIPRLRDAAAYVTAGGAGSYWNGNAGATGDTDVQTLNASLQSLVAEFDAALAFADMDGAIQKYPNYYYVGDGVRFDESGVHAMASAFVDQVNATIPLVDFRSINHDYHDTTVVGLEAFTMRGPVGAAPAGSTISPSSPRYRVNDYCQLVGMLADVGRAPTDVAVISDLLRNGVSVYTTTANRPSIGVAATTAGAPAVPDVTFLSPNDYLTAAVVQGTGSALDLTLIPLVRKIPPP